MTYPHTLTRTQAIAYQEKHTPADRAVVKQLADRMGARRFQLSQDPARGHGAGVEALDADGELLFTVWAGKIAIYQGTPGWNLAPAGSMEIVYKTQTAREWPLTHYRRSAHKSVTIR